MRSRTAGVMTILMRNGRDRRSENPLLGHARKERVVSAWDRSADHIRASGHSGCIARGQASKRKQAVYMAAPERFAKKSDFSLAPRAPSIHGPGRVKSLRSCEPVEDSSQIERVRSLSKIFRLQMATQKKIDSIDSQRQRFFTQAGPNLAVGAIRRARKLSEG